MVARRYRIAVAAGALVIIGWLPLMFAWPNGPSEHLAIGALFGTVFGQTTLASAWVPFGPGRLIWRLPLSVAWIGSMILVFARNVATRQGQDLDVVMLMSACLFGQWSITQSLLWGLAFGYGLRLRHVDDPQKDSRRERQFGIRQLMLVTLIVAIFLGTGRAFVMNFGLSFMGEHWTIYAFLCVAAIAMTLPVLIAGLLPRQAVPAVLVCLVLVGVATLWELPLISRLANSPGPSQSPSEKDFIAINGVTLAWVVAFLMAVRLCGYGLAGHPALGTRKA